MIGASCAKGRFDRIWPNGKPLGIGLRPARGHDVEVNRWKRQRSCWEVARPEKGSVTSIG
jgi:hypothetical protein